MGCSASTLQESSTAPPPSPPPTTPPTFMAPVIHRPPTAGAHSVSLTSSTYGSLVFTNPRPNTKSTPDSVINSWELMDGLDDEDEDFHLVGKTEFREKPFFCTATVEHDAALQKLLETYEIVDTAGSTTNAKPLWKHLSDESLLAEMDPNVAESYNLALSSKANYRPKPMPVAAASVKMVSESDAADAVIMDSVSDVTISSVLDVGDSVKLKNGKVVFYFTSLRGIRKTYEDCRAIKMILDGLTVAVDERDINMDVEYRKELKDLLALEGKTMAVPQLFIGGKLVGGADEVRQLHEAGELTQMLEGYPVRDCVSVCHVCGDARFLPCTHCSGSTKVFDEEDGAYKKCLGCNENGLIRCPGCHS